MSGGTHPIAILQKVLDDACELGVFPSAQAVVLHRGAQVFGGVAGKVSGDTRFDLASLTKVISTTSLFLRLWTEGKVGPETLVSRYFPGTPVGDAGVTVADLLYHRSGLPPFVPFFAQALTAHPELLDADCPSALRARVRDEVIQAAAATPLAAEPQTLAAYSDVGFILLGEILSRAAGAPLDTLFSRHVAEPLGLSARFHRLTDFPADAMPAPTGATRPREPAPGQETLWKDVPTQPTRLGEVDDDNAWVMDGVAGHAGLFGTAVDVARFGQAVLDGCAGGAIIAPGPLWHRALATDPKVQASTRSMGFDSPSEGVSSAGHYIGDTPPGAVGHLGFTGTSLWVDLRRSLVVALVTNRVANGRQETRIRDFRPLFHDFVVEALELTETKQGHHG
ncbi:beta-lactamase [Myxococcus xanthus DK 1622]|uniref:Beta-lactamase n=1 Tax=Myxococcus xanthus (strain DK1622) TaxID=246197 RepID=Q1DB18_MYXXD|nr:MULTISPECIES: serine hydrolase domain-containing protein [Myxococcus]ABF86202.1 beta-lactamase [Myxococcus xanthus DK 1622]NOJ54832.1 beta-lactamase family protein [Myxococcus xanthus]QPM81496.1 beta-lactamase family protein [Myxococcus xanthus]QVW70746.1 beta-lactamase family protein [Myxococcus xanthus DZ2]QZZ49657.1 Putative D-alanyl-D-alanine carboxypeptidase [Myxococcus xanthus]